MSNTVSVLSLRRAFVEIVIELKLIPSVSKLILKNEEAKSKEINE